MSKSLKTHNRRLTTEQIEHLRVSRHVKSVSESTVKFTEEFKRYFYDQMIDGKSGRQIFLECGIDPDVLGDRRIEGLRRTLREQAKREEGFSDQRQHNYHRPPRTGDESVETRIKHLEHELAYTRQEVEFLKKLQTADMEARRQWESKHQPK